MLGPKEVINVIRNSRVNAYVRVDAIAAFSMPDEKTNIRPRLLVTDVRSPFTRFASDHATAQYKTVQVQGWFSITDNIEATRLEINRAMEDAGWFNNYDAGIDTDPDTGELFMTMQYSKNDRSVTDKWLN